MSNLVAYALQGLNRCWIPEYQRYSHRYKFDPRHPGNESVFESDIFYTLNVLLGLSTVPATFHGKPDGLHATYDSCCGVAGDPRLKTYAYGMALWTGATLGFAPPDRLIDHVTMLLTSSHALDTMTAQDVGMLASGSIAMSVKDGGRWRALADMLVERLRHHYYNSRTNLFYNQPNGFRRNFSSFASQVYAMLALYQYGEAFGADWAIQLANEASRRIISLQGPLGEWAWFYYVPGGRIVDFYEVYSVHQHGMAPAFLHHAVAHGVAGAREALIKGFNWLFGLNQMNVSMLRPVESMFYRSQLRRGELETSWPRILRSVLNAALVRSDAVRHHHGLVLREECRSYELGWILWSFGDRTDYPELTNRSEFSS